MNIKEPLDLFETESVVEPTSMPLGELLASMGDRPCWHSVLHDTAADLLESGRENPRALARIERIADYENGKGADVVTAQAFSSGQATWLIVEAFEVEP